MFYMFGGNLAHQSGGSWQQAEQLGRLGEHHRPQPDERHDQVHPRLAQMRPLARGAPRDSPANTRIRGTTAGRAQPEPSRGAGQPCPAPTGTS